MNIAILGAGNVGTSLGDRLAAKGHSVVYGSRSPEKYKDGGRKFDTFAHAIAKSEVVLLAVPWAAAEEVLKSNDFSGKIVIDCLNPIGPNFELTVSGNDSAGEMAGRLAKGARVVKAFNTTGFANMQKPQFGDTRLTMLYAGDDDAAKATVKQLIDDVGFDPVDAGPLKNSRYLESLAMLWINLFFQKKHDIAFQLIER
jgi:8-hydroxy-5-deazaflavin:NADPH oxidoreductase